MPVNSQQRVQAAQAIGVLHREGTYRQVYTKMKGVLPKGLRGSILKLLDWPTSWAVLYDLSPAQISQNREAETARGVWDSTGTSYAGGANKTRMWKRLLGGYFVGQPDPMSQSNFPNWRKPSWMTDAEAAEIKEFIRTSYNSIEPLEDTMPVEDGEVSMSSEMTDDTPPVETQPEPTPEPTGSNVTRLNVVQGIYALYGSYFRRIFEVDEAGYVLQMESRFSPTRKAAESILTLEKLGFATGAISAMLDTFANRSLSITGLRQGNKRNYGAYIVVDLRGVRSSASAYQRRISKDIMAVMGGVSPSRVDRQFAPSTGRGLQTFKFSGMRRGQVVGLQVLSLNDINSVPNEDSLRDGNSKMLLKKEEARESLQTQVNAGSTAEPTEQPATTTQTSPDSIRFIGFQYFTEGQTYRSQGNFYISLNNFPDDGRTYSYVFYFARENEQGSYDLFRSVFGAMPSDGRIRNQPNSDDRLAQLKMAWNSSGRLSSENSIELQDVPLLDKRRLRAAFGEQEEAGLTSPGRNFSVSRSQMFGSRVAFAQISPTPLAMIASMGQRFRAMGSQEPDNDELVGGSTAENEQQNASVARNVEAIKTKKIDRTFAYEIEGNMMGATSSSNYQSTLGTAIDKVLNERGLNANRDRYQLNGRGDQRFSTVTVKGDGSVDGPRPFEVDTPVFIPPEIDIAKTNFDEAVSQRKFNDMKWDTYPNMWQWVSVFSEAMLQAGVRIHKSSGLHIHISSSDYNRDDFKRYLENYAGFEPLLDLMMPVNSRKGGRSYNSSIIQEGAVTTGYSRGGRTPNPSPSSWRNSGNTGRSKVRTQTGIGTIEFRHPMTNIEGDLIKHFIILAYSLVEVSKIKKFSSFKFSDLESFLPDATATFLYNRIEDLDQPDLPKSKQRAFFGDNPRGRGTQSQLERKNLE